MKVKYQMSEMNDRMEKLLEWKVLWKLEQEERDKLWIGNENLIKCNGGKCWNFS